MDERQMKETCCCEIAEKKTHTHTIKGSDGCSISKFGVVSLLSIRNRSFVQMLGNNFIANCNFDCAVYREVYMGNVKNANTANCANVTETISPSVIPTE